MLFRSGTVEVAADKTVTVDDVKLTGTVTLKAGATLNVSGEVTVEGADITAEAGAKIVVQDGADVSALAGMGLKFYNSNGDEFTLPAARTTMEVAAIPAGTYAYDETLSGWKRTELYVDPEACTHEERTAHAAVDATCTEDGNVAYWTCNSCGKNFDAATAGNEIADGEEVIEATGHDQTLTHTEAQDPTCTEAGNIEYWTCGSCSTNFSDAAGTTVLEAGDEVEEATGHTWNDGVEKTAATCEGNQVKTFTCTVQDCGATEDRETENSALGHDFETSSGNHVCKNDASHTHAVPTADGEKVEGCAECDKLTFN